MVSVTRQRYVGRDDIVSAAARFSYLLSSAASMSEAVTAAVAAVAGLWRLSLTLQLKLSWNHSRIMINDLSASHDTLGGQETVTRDA